MTELDCLADELGTSGRTLRRAAARGLIRCERRSPYKPVVSAGERRYLRGHWGLLSTLLGALRTEHNVRLAVLYGSAARGGLHCRSDVDLLLALGDEERGLPVARLGLKLEELLDRPVQIVSLAQAEQSPLLLADVLREGRVIVDRDGLWVRLTRRSQSVRAAAERQEAELGAAAWSVLERASGAG